MYSPGDQIATVHTGAWDLDLSNDVLSDVTIRHGAEQFDVAQARMSAAAFTVRVPRGAANYWYLGQVGNSVRITTGTHRRFTGHITDIAYQWENTPEQGWMLMHRVTCVGVISRLGSRLLPDTSWPAADHHRPRGTYPVHRLDVDRRNLRDTNRRLQPAETSRSRTRRDNPRPRRPRRPTVRSRRRPIRHPRRHRGVAKPVVPQPVT